MNEPIRIVADWLADGTNGVNAEIDNLTLDAGDTAPTDVAAVLNETESTIIALGRIPDDQAVPFLMVWQLGDLIWQPENQGKQDAAQPLEIGIAYIDRDSNAQRAVEDSGYVLRAAKRSLNRLHRPANSASQTLLSVTLRSPTRIRITRPTIDIEQAFISRVIAVTYTNVRDEDP